MNLTHHGAVGRRKNKWKLTKLGSKLLDSWEWENGKSLDGSSKVQTWTGTKGTTLTFDNGKRPAVNNGLVFAGAECGYTSSVSLNGSEVFFVGESAPDGLGGYLYEHTANAVSNRSKLLQFAASVSVYQDAPGGPGGLGSCYNWTNGNPGYECTTLIHHVCDGVHASHAVRVNDEVFPMTQLPPYTNNCGTASVSGALFLGGRNNTPSFRGTCKQLVVCGQPLTTSERAKVTKLLKKKRGLIDPGRVCLIGDSLTAKHATHESVASYISPLDPSHCITLAKGGETVDAQTTRWNGAGIYGSPKGTGRLQYVYILIGINNLLALGETDATIKTKVQALITNIRNAHPNAWIVLFALSPCYGWMEANAPGTKDTLLARWLAYNAEVQAKNFTGVNVFVTSHVAELSDGENRLAGPFNSGDGLHGTNEMSQLLANKCVAAKTAANNSVI